VAGRFRLQGVTRPESASPATGSKSSHQFEQNLLMRQALGEPGES
jgi:2-oxoglutarate dehydrogenase complex dehydrogenase (E1) component-like enzyme